MERYCPHLSKKENEYNSQNVKVLNYSNVLCQAKLQMNHLILKRCFKNKIKNYCKALSWSGILLPTHNREPGSVALASLSTVLMLCNAAVGGQGIFLLHFWDIQSAKWGQEETVTCGGQQRRSKRSDRYVSLYFWLTNVEFNQKYIICISGIVSMQIYLH